MDTAFKANPEGSWLFGKSSGTTEEKTGHLMAKPIPLAKVNIKSAVGDKFPKNTNVQRTEATIATHT